MRALVRQPAPLIERVDAWQARGLDDLVALRAAVSGVEAVVHLAAHVHHGSIPADDSSEALRFREVNVQGTRGLLDAAVAAGVRDFVFASSVKAVGEESVTPWTEETPPAPVDAYGRTKLEAERVVRDQAGRHGLHAPVLRLPLVYGPGMKANALRLFDAVARRIPLPLGAVHNLRSFLFTGNLVEAIFATLESERGNDTFFVSDGEEFSTPDFLRAIGQALQRPARLVPVPTVALRAAGRVGDLLTAITPFPLNSAMVERLIGSLAVDISRLKRWTGYRPPYPTHEGLRITAEWYLRERELR